MKTKTVKRRAFICTGCEFVYCDEPPSSCDCMNTKRRKFLRGQITYQQSVEKTK
jgi:hypothetical protein